MPELVIDCPETGEPVPTGVIVQKEVPETVVHQGNSVRCPHCGNVHEWRIGEARLKKEGDSPAS